MHLLTIHEGGEEYECSDDIFCYLEVKRLPAEEDRSLTWNRKEKVLLANDRDALSVGWNGRRGWVFSESILILNCQQDIANDTAGLEFY